MTTFEQAKRQAELRHEKAQGGRSSEYLTVRDYFAAHAPEPPVDWHGGDRKVADLIEWRWRYADAMLRAREA
jgi:hypothetical protein